MAGVDELFVQLYSLYPRKEGKTRGRKVFEKLLRDGHDFDAIASSLKNYIRLLQQERREKKYIKHFDTWLRNYEDYLTPEGGPDGGGNKDLARRILAGDL